MLEDKRCRYLIERVDTDFDEKYLKSKMMDMDIPLARGLESERKLFFAILDKRYNTVKCMIQDMDTMTWNSKKSVTALRIAAAHGDLRMFKELWAELKPFKELWAKLKLFDKEDHDEEHQLLMSFSLDWWKYRYYRYHHR